jgi:hypothetical protein
MENAAVATYPMLSHRPATAAVCPAGTPLSRVQRESRCTVGAV